MPPAAQKDTPFPLSKLSIKSWVFRLRQRNSLCIECPRHIHSTASNRPLQSLRSAAHRRYGDGRELRRFERQRLDRSPHSHRKGLHRVPVNRLQEIQAMLASASSTTRAASVLLSRSDALAKLGTCRICFSLTPSLNRMNPIEPHEPYGSYASQVYG